MLLTTAQFRRACFYAGSGTDLQPLLRFSALTDTFIYMCAGYDITPEAVTASIFEKLANLNASYPNSLVMTGPPVPIQPADLEHEAPRRWQTLLRRSFAEDHLGRFSRFPAPESWGLEFPLVRNFGSLGRKLRLLFIWGEALGTYLALSRNGRVPPVIFCAIQTNEFEFGDGVMVPFFARHEHLPDFWVRGVWVPSREEREFTERLARVMRPAPPFPHFAQTYDNWDSRLGADAATFDYRQENATDRCIVRAFASHPLRLGDVVQVSRGRSGVFVRNRLLERTELANFDAVFASERMVARWMQQWGELPANIRALAPTVRCGLAPPLRPTMLSLVDALEQLSRAAATTALRKVALVATGFEDEGRVLEEWAQHRGRTFRTEVFSAEPLDFAELRGWRPRRN